MPHRLVVRRPRPVSTLGLTVMLVAVTSSSAAFAPNHLKVPGSGSHATITSTAILGGEGTGPGSAETLLGITTPTLTMRRAVEEIVEGNVVVDDTQTLASLHFDGESFLEGQQRLQRLMNRVVDDLTRGNVLAARDDLGRALHTVQDFYAHSNWVELHRGDLGGLQPEPFLAHPDHPILGASPTTPVCNDEGALTPTGLLTSGYYAGVHALSLIGIALPTLEDHVAVVRGKCRHGGPTDGSSGEGGINKDSVDTTFSPHAAFHQEAVDLARRATRDFIAEIAGRVSPARLRLLLGAGPMLAIVMSVNVAGAGDVQTALDKVESWKQQAIRIVEARRGTEDQPSLYALATFDITFFVPSVVSTDDPETFLQLIRAVTLQSHGDCVDQEPLRAIAQALAGIADGGDLYLFTDALVHSADVARVDRVGAALVRKHFRAFPVVFGPCLDGTKFSQNHPNLGGLEVYSRLAQATGGQVFGSGGVDLVPLVRPLTSGDAVELLLVTDALSGSAISSLRSCWNWRIRYARIRTGYQTASSDERCGMHWMPPDAAKGRSRQAA